VNALPDGPHPTSADQLLDTVLAPDDVAAQVGSVLGERVHGKRDSLPEATTGSLLGSRKAYNAGDPEREEQR
jgi:hypothetical protein